VEHGMSRFFQKLNSSYVQYFNQKHNRKGVLCETKFKRIEITNQQHFTHLPYYIHSNPLDLFDYGWRKRELMDTTGAWRFLGNYPWSSHLDYLGKNNFSSIIKKDFLLEYFGGTEGYNESFRQWINDIRISGSDIYLE
jgi:hypothetical protein